MDLVIEVVVDIILQLQGIVIRVLEIIVSLEKGRVV